MEHPVSGGRHGMPATRASSARAVSSGAAAPPATNFLSSVRKRDTATAAGLLPHRRRWPRLRLKWHHALWLGLPLAACGLYYYLAEPASAPHKPVAADFRLSGNFGELRRGHFHMGLDVRTYGKEDLPVYAVAAGYVSRVLIQEYGLGKAVFVTHANGTTTVYAHLNRFYDALQAAVEDRQQAQRSRNLDLSFTAGRFPVARGQRIALSGNTGGSEAPHLHFEVRDSRSGHNLNPLLHGFRVDDDTPPQLAGLYWYNRQYSTYRMRANPISIAGEKGHYRAVRPVVKVRSALISLGIRAADRSHDNRFRFGIYRSVVLLDGVQVHEMVLDDIAPADSRYINACVDYPAWTRTGIFIQHLSTLPGNQLPPRKGRGLLDLSDGRVHQLRIELYDVNGNRTVFDSQLQYTGVADAQPALPRGAVLLAPGKAQTVTSPSASVSFGGRAFYDTVAFGIEEKPSAHPTAASMAVQLQPASVPVHESYRISLLPNRPLTPAAKKKVVMQLNTGRQLFTAKGTWQGDRYSAAFNELGTVQLLVDTRAPSIGLAGWENGAPFEGDEILLPLVCLDESGPIATFSATLQGQWLLYDSKGKDFVVRLPAGLPRGRHQLTVTVADVAGNVTTELFTFIKR